MDETLTEYSKLRSLYPFFQEALLEALRELKKRHSEEELAATLSPSCQAAYIRDLAYANIQSELVNDNEVAFELKNQMKYIKLPECLVRIKKFDKNLQSKNIITEQQKDWESDSLFGYDFYLPRVDVGYQLDAEELEILHIIAKFRERDRNVRFEYIYRSYDDGQQVLFDISDDSVQAKDPFTVTPKHKEVVVK